MSAYFNIISYIFFFLSCIDDAVLSLDEPRYQGHTMEVDHWMRLIEDTMSDVLCEHETLVAPLSTNATLHISGMYNLSKFKIDITT